MGIDAITQVWVSIFGLSALWLMMSKNEKRRKIGIILGLIGQPAWYAQLTINDQWGMLPVFIGYTASWIYGFWTHWIRESP